MTRRAAYLAALRGDAADQLIWAPNFDHWYHVNRANGTLPAAYREMAPNDIIRAVDGTIWRRVSLVREAVDPSVEFTRIDDGDAYTTLIRTPVGEISTRHRQAPDSSKAWFLVDHRVKRAEDLRVLRYVIEATSYTLDTSAYEAAVREVGEDGIVLTCLPCVPFIEFAKMDVGYANAYYLMADYPEEVEAVLQAYQAKFLEAYRLAAQGPCPLVSNGDNMDQLTCPPHYFTRYAVPFYQQVRDILHAGGKIAQGHWCGQLATILPLVPTCGLDVIEAVTPKPMSQVDMRTAMDICEGSVVIQGGIPSVFMCRQGCTREELADYIRTLLEQIGHRRGIILGMGDNVPPDADFDRVRMVSDIVAEWNAQVVSH